MAPSRTKKMTENPRVKKAPKGLSQKLSCSYQTWRPTSRRSLRPWNDPVVGADASPVGVVGGVGGVGEVEEDVAHLTDFSIGSAASLVRCR
jgi:hypothetical protein